jgi:hypothetical protein
MRRLVLIGCALCLAAAGMALAGQMDKGKSPEEAAKAEVAAKAAAPSKLDIIKKLAGDWVEVGKDGKATDKVVTTYRVTAGGSAVEEVIFRGTPHEMITLYHLDGDDLMLTHYCVAGNQPSMKAEKQSDPSRLVFQCAGGTNMKSENDEHMHRATIVWKDDNHIDSEWIEVKDGKNTFTAAFSLARK